MGVFIVTSITVRMRRGDWLLRAGPFEVADSSAEELERTVKTLEERLAAREEEAYRLNEEIRVAGQVVAHLMLKEEREGDD